MAVALDTDQEIVHFSFPIEKREETAAINPVDGTPDLLIWGKATDGTVDADRQIVDPQWSGVALKEWLATKANVRMAHDAKRPVGKGMDVQCTMDGHYVKSLITDPLAKHFIRTGVLNDYSVGISNPHIKFGPDRALDPLGKATGGIITGRPDGLTKFAEISVVDRGSNFNSEFQIAKSAAGNAEFTGMMIGDEDEIAKAAPASLTKAADSAVIKAVAADETRPVDISSFKMPDDLSITFTPSDMAKLVRNKIIEQHYDELALKAILEAESAVYKRDIDTATRRRLAADGKALPGGCLAAETLVATRQGPRRIDSLIGECELLTDAGWVQAEVRSFGIQPLLEVTLRRGRLRRTVYATAEHRWLTDDREWKLTSDLHSGDRIPHVEVHGESVYPDRFNAAKRPVAVNAEQAANSARHMVMVDMERRPALACPTVGAHDFRYSSADRAATLLLDRHGLEVGVCDAVLPSQCRIPATQPALISELYAVSADLGAFGHAEAAVGAAELAWRADVEVGVGASDPAYPADDRTAIGDRHPVRLLGRVLRAKLRQPLLLVVGVAKSLGFHGFAAFGNSAVGHTSNRTRSWIIERVKETVRCDEVFCAVVPDLHRFALANGILTGNSYPIETSGDLDNAATLARSGHGDVAAARRLIARRAKELGVANPLDESDEVKKSITSQVQNGIASIDEVRESLDLPAWGVPETSEPVIVTQQGPVPASEAKRLIAKAQAAEAAEQTDTRAEAALAKAEKADTPAEQAEAVPDVTKEPKPKPVKKAKKKPKKMPPWLNKPDDDGDSDDDSSCKSVTDHLWTGVEGTSDIVCSKCHTTPAAAAGVTASTMDPAPVGELQESSPPSSVKGATPASASGAVAATMTPVPAHREPDGATVEAFEQDAGLTDGDHEAPNRLEAPALKHADLAPDPEVAALLRFKMTGVDEDLGRLHDLTCPAYHPEDVAKYHPYADLRDLIQSGAWQRKTLAAAAGPLAGALKMQEAWQAALALKSADPAQVNQWRLDLYKAFRDANPGPGSFPTPGSVSPQRYCRPVLTDGRGAGSPAYDGPNTSPQVATTAPNAQGFDRPPLSAGHQSPSPSHMKWDSGEYPAERGTPVQLDYAQMKKEHQRMALVRMHDHLSRQFPEVCPLNTVNADGLDDRPLRGVQPEGHPVPAIAGIGKSISPGPGPDSPAGVLKAEPEQDGQFTEVVIGKGMKKRMKKLGKKVISGKITRDQALSDLGRRFTQKTAETEPGVPVKKAVAPAVPNLFLAHPEVRKSFEAQGGLVSDEGCVLQWPDREPRMSPEAVKAAVAEATADLKDLLIKQQETFTVKLAEQQRVIDAIADQPDPSTAAFSGLAFQPSLTKAVRRPAAVPDQAEYAARAQEMVRRNLHHTYSTHSNPQVREAAGEALNKLGVEAAPMT